jgi:putative ATPase
MQAVSFIGWPEARISLAQAVIALALAPKSNAAYLAIDAALADVRNGLAGPVPPHLRDGHYKGAAKLGHAQGYIYPHDEPAGIAAQQYAPDSIHGRRYYNPSRHGVEERYADRVEKIRAMLSPSSGADRDGDGDGDGSGARDDADRAYGTDRDDGAGESTP